MTRARMRSVRIILWSAIGIAAVTLAALALSGSLLPPMSLPLAASIGGPFELTSHTGRRIRDGDLRGKPFAIFFGFTQCPDVCPTTLLDVSNHLTALGEAADRLNVIFVTVDVNAGVIFPRMAGVIFPHFRQQEGPRARGPSCCLASFP